MSRSRADGVQDIAARIASLPFDVGVSARTQQLAVNEIRRHDGCVLYDYELSVEGAATDPIYAVWSGKERGLAVDVYRSVHLVCLDDPFVAVNTADDSIVDVILRRASRSPASRMGRPTTR